MFPVNDSSPAESEANIVKLYQILLTIQAVPGRLVLVSFHTLLHVIFAQLLLNLPLTTTTQIRYIYLICDNVACGQSLIDVGVKRSQIAVQRRFRLPWCSLVYSTATAKVVLAMCN